MRKLQIASNLSLPLDFVTSTQVILAQKGKGKSYTAAVQAEELLDAGQQIVVVDPTGAHWGLRSSPNGRSTGFSIAVLGGEHADVPLEVSAGEVIADAIATEHFSAIVDLTLFRKGEALRFMAVFLETLYRRNRTPLHLFIDEADVVAPQKTFGPEQARVLGAAEDIVRRGRIRGIGCTLITQRPQVLNKDVLTQADMLTTLGMNHPKDLGAIEAWVAVHGDPYKAKTMIESLPSLPKGDAWVWNPSIDLFKRVKIRERHTFDSGRTPKSGERKVEAKVLAPVDIKRLGASIAATVERQKADDPKALKKRCADLTAELEKARHAKQPKIEMKTVTKAIVKDGQIARVESAIARFAKVVVAVEQAQARATLAMAELRQVLAKATTPSIIVAQSPGNRPVRAGETSAAKATPRVPGGHPTLTRRDRGDDTINGALKPAHLRILSSIAWWESIGVETPDLAGVAFVAKASAASSTFANNRATLRVGGYVDYPSTGRVRLTDVGRELAPVPAIPATRAALHNAVLGMTTPAVGRLLRVLLDAYPREVSLDDLAKDGGASISSSTFANNRSWLRARGLAEYPRTGFVRAAELLFPESVS